MTSGLARRILRAGLLIVPLVLTPAPGAVKTAQPEKILIRNVRLIDREGQTEERTVSILIEVTKLDLVTMDEIALEDDLIAYDGDNGVVMGALLAGDRGRLQCGRGARAR
jgi:hypothetical protein